MRILTLALILSINYIFAQDFKFGKVTDLELSHKVHELDSSAPAAILYRKETVNFVFSQGQGFTQEREVHERIKIYNQDGYDWATKSIYLYKGSGGSNEKLSGLKGYTYNLNDGKIIEDKLRNDNIFDEELNEFYEITKLTMPNIQDGSVIEYTYKIVSPFLDIDDIEVQNSIPINKLEIKIGTPQYFAYNRWMNPRADYIFRLNESKETKSVNFTNNVSSRMSYTSLGSTGRSSSRSEYSNNIIEINESNIPALKEEAYAGSIDNFMAKLSLELTATLNDFGGVEESYSTSWEKVSKSIYDSSSFGNQLDRTGFFDNDVDAITDGVEDPFQLAFMLQEFVKSKVSWNGNYGFISYSGTKKAYDEGVGNVGDINLLLTAMLRYKGVKAYPVLVSTRNHGIPLFPTRKGFNYVICMVENSDGNYMLFDASEKYSSPNVLPVRALNWQGRLIKEDGSSSWIPLRSSSSSNESTSLNVTISPDLSVNGKVRKMFSSYGALRYRSNFSKLSEEDHIKALEKDKGSIQVSELEFENAEEVGQPVKLSYEYNLEDGLDEVGNNIYFSPLLFLATKESPFKLDQRKYPIDFTMPFEDKYLVNILLPDGFVVESIPESGILDFKDGAARFSYVSKQNGKYLQFSINFELKESLILPQDYEVFKDFFEKMIEKQNEQVVLSKA